MSGRRKRCARPNRGSATFTPARPTLNAVESIESRKDTVQHGGCSGWPSGVNRGGHSRESRKSRNPSNLYPDLAGLELHGRLLRRTFSALDVEA